MSNFPAFLFHLHTDQKPPQHYPGPTRVAQTLSGPSCVLFERHLLSHIINAFLFHAWSFLTSFESLVSLQHLSIGWEKRVEGKSPLQSYAVLKDA